jgi:adenosylmethionine-8-amino-7-oxononanoate aminotransferase
MESQSTRAVLVIRSPKPSRSRAMPERIAAFVLEPIIDAGGVRFPPEGYLDIARSPDE